MKNKNVLVTGGAGFIGSHLVSELVTKKAIVTVTVKYKSIIDCPRLAGIWDKVNVVECDLRNLDSVIQLKDSSFDYIFHLAAYNHVGDSFKHIHEAINSNMLATANLMEFGPAYKRFIYTATSEVYGYQTDVPFMEENMPFPISPYAIGKYGGELYARMKRHQTKNEIICLRPFNTFGPYQSERAIIPELIMKCLRGEPIKTTQGKQTREFNYVANIVEGFLAAAHTEKIPDHPVNIGAGEEISIRDLVRKIHTLCDSSSDLLIGALPDRPTEIWRMKSDRSKAEQFLGWTPKIPLDEGLKLTIEWYRKFLKIYRSAEGLPSLSNWKHANNKVSI